MDSGVCAAVLVRVPLRVFVDVRVCEKLDVGVLVTAAVPLRLPLLLALQLPLAERELLAEPVALVVEAPLKVGVTVSAGVRGMVDVSEIDADDDDDADALGD